MEIQGQARTVWFQAMEWRPWKRSDSDGRRQGAYGASQSLKRLHFALPPRFEVAGFAELRADIAARGSQFSSRGT